MELLTLKQLEEKNYPMAWIKRITHSVDFEEAGGIREPIRGSEIRFNISKLDKYLEIQTRRIL